MRKNKKKERIENFKDLFYFFFVLQIVILQINERKRKKKNQRRAILFNNTFFFFLIFIQDTIKLKSLLQFYIIRDSICFVFGKKKIINFAN